MTGRTVVGTGAKDGTGGAAARRLLGPQRGCRPRRHHEVVGLGTVGESTGRQPHSGTVDGGSSRR
jgi:NAD(P)-dependent dehydrogenase (short-subunit alcohol dehydrogenase family)